MACKGTGLFCCLQGLTQLATFQLAVLEDWLSRAHSSGNGTAMVPSFTDVYPAAIAEVNPPAILLLL